MWYRSKSTGKVFHSSTETLLDNIVGDGYFQRTVEAGWFIPVEPTVIDVLRDTGSINLAVIRYRELHSDCDYTEAKRQVKILRSDMARFGNRKRRVKKWKKKNDAAKPADSENSSDTGK